MHFHREKPNMSNVHLKCWGIPSFEKEPNRKITKSRTFPSFERKYNRKITKSRKVPSFEKRIYLENFETVENLHRKCWKKPNMSIAKVEIISHHPDCLVCVTRCSWCNFPSILVTVIYSKSFTSKLKKIKVKQMKWKPWSANNCLYVILKLASANAACD